MEHSVHLFLAEDGSPQEFCINPGPERARLRPLIEHGGGKIVSTDKDNTIRLVSPNHKAKNSKCILSKYIDDCVRENRLLPTEDYRVDGEAEVSDDSIFDGLDANIVRTSARDRKGRQRYLLSEDTSIIQYLVQTKPRKLLGNTMWKKMENLKVTKHTWQSMKDRFLKTIVPSITSYHLTAAHVQVLTSHLPAAQQSAILNRLKPDKDANGGQDNLGHAENNAMSADYMSQEFEYVDEGSNKRGEDMMVSSSSESMDEFDRLLVLQSTSTPLNGQSTHKVPATEAGGEQQRGTSSDGDTEPMQSSPGQSPVSFRQVDRSISPVETQGTNKSLSPRKNDKTSGLKASPTEAPSKKAKPAASPREDAADVDNRGCGMNLRNRQGRRRKSSGKRPRVDSVSSEESNAVKVSPSPTAAKRTRLGQGGDTSNPTSTLTNTEAVTGDTNILRASRRIADKSNRDTSVKESLSFASSKTGSPKKSPLKDTVLATVSHSPRRSPRKHDDNRTSPMSGSNVSSPPDEEQSELPSCTMYVATKLKAVEDICVWLGMAPSDFVSVLHAASGNVNHAVNWILHGSYKGYDLWSPMLDNELMGDEKTRADLVQRLGAEAVEKRSRYLNTPVL